MNSVITDIHQITAAWLTQTLRAEGYLDRGHVTDFDVTSTGENCTTEPGPFLITVTKHTFTLKNL
mgnify:CR=1 FL=1